MNLYIYRNLSEDFIIKNLFGWKENGDISCYYAACNRLLETRASLKEYICGILLKTAPYVSPDTRAYFHHDINEIYDNFIAYDWNTVCEKYGVLPLPDFSFTKSNFANDVNIAENIPDNIAENMPEIMSDYKETLSKLVNAGSASTFGKILIEFFNKYSCADEAEFDAFKWEGGRLCGIPEIDGISFDDLAALGYRKDTLIYNTEAFINNRPAHDVLLVGASGTGKSSCIKAVFNMFRPCGLKLVEILKEDISTLNELINVIKNRKQLYIVFIDDLSFDGSEAEYKALKVTLDGQIERRAGNMLIYATSNRVHLVRETWKDRNTEQDIHENDTLHEKMSLSERFGIRLYFSALSQPEYFEIVALLLKKHGIEFNDEIGKQAVAWELGNNGRSGRTARQFVTDYLSHKKI